MQRWKAVTDRIWELDNKFRIYPWTDNECTKHIMCNKPFPTTRAELDKYAASFHAKQGHFAWFRFRAVNKGLQRRTLHTTY